MKTEVCTSPPSGPAEVTPRDVEEAAELVQPHRERRRPMQDVVEDLSFLRRTSGKAS